MMLLPLRETVHNIRTSYPLDDWHTWRPPSVGITSQVCARHPFSKASVVGVSFIVGLCTRTHKRRPAAYRSAGASADLGVLDALHPVLSASVRRSLEEMPDAEVLFIGPKEEIGGVKGMLGEQNLQSLRQCAPDSYDLLVEARSEEVLAGAWEARQNRFYPLGGHEFSLSNDFIINLASISKVLRNGGKFWFLTSASSEDEVLPFSFLALPHLDWKVEVVPDAANGVSAVCCTLNKHASADTLRRTPAVVAQECLEEMSRKRYFDAIRPYLKNSTGLGSAEVVVTEDGAPWPFEDGQFDVVILAFVLHHVPLSGRELLLAESVRVGREVLVLEDLPDAAATPDARRLAWHVTQEHFRPFGQDPDDYISGVLSDDGWRHLFDESSLEILEAVPISRSLRYPVPHVLYRLQARN